MTGPLAEIDAGLLLVFLCGTVVAVWSTVVVAGFLPRRSAPAGARGPLGGALTCISAALIVALVGVLLLTMTHLPLAVAVIVAGLAILGAPFMVEPIPAHIRESTLALVATAVLPAAALTALPWPV